VAEKIRVLYVDDEPPLLEIATLFLERGGTFAVMTSTSATTALDMLATHSFDAIVSDYQMPGMDGIAFLKAVRERFVDVPFILFTGRGREEIAIEALNSGADFYIQKGGDPASLFAELEHKVRQATGRRQAEHLRRESEKRLLDIIDFLPDATFAIDRAGTVIAWNRAMEEMTGRSAAEMLGKGDHEYAIPFYGTRRPLLIDLALSSCDDTRLYDSFVRDDRGGLTAETSDARPRGRPCVLWGRATPLMDAEGAITGAIESIRDITSTKLAEQRLTSDREYLDRILSTVQAGIAIIDPVDHTILDINTAGAQMIGASREAIIGNTCHRFICPSESGRCPITDLDQTVDNAERTLVTADGTRIPIVKYVTRTVLDGRECLLETFIDNRERRRAEDTMRESEKKFRTFVELSLDGIIITDLSGTLRFANRAAGAIVDAPDYEALIGTRNIMEFVAPTSRAAVLRDLAQVAQGIDAYPVTYTLITAAGREIRVECIGRRIPYEHSVALLVSMRDVTGRALAEEALREAADTFVGIFQSNPVALALVTVPGGTFVDVNEAFVAGSGYSRDEVIGRTARDVGIFADPHEAALLTSRLQEVRAVDGMEVQCRSRSGEIRTCRFTAGVIPVHGTPHILCSVEDVTERTKAEEALRESELLFREVFDNANDAVYLVERAPDGPGLFLLVNETAVRMLGYTKEEFLTMSPRDIVPGEVATRTMPGTRERLVRDGFTTFESANRRKDGSVFPVEVGLRSFPYRGNDVDLSIVRDITGRKQAEDAVRAANRKLSLLSSITRHDIMNQLLALDGFLALLRGRDLDPGFEHCYSRIEGASHQIASMIQFTKEYEEIGVRTPVWQDFRGLVATMARDAVPGQIALHNDLPAGAEVYADPLIVKVVFNLVDNAVRHGGRVTTIRFSLEARGDDRIIVCADDGDGVAADQKERIFGRGFGKNTGFGLAISREILDITGIEIEETGEPGKGARFEIKVPARAFRSRCS
jgi:PAS domain S-box-containing protein